MSPCFLFAAILYRGSDSVSSFPSEAFLKFLMLLPIAPPSSGSFPAPNTTSTIRSIKIISGIPIPNTPTSLVEIPEQFQHIAQSIGLFKFDYFSIIYFF